MAEPLDELIAKLESAAEGSGALSWELALAIGWARFWDGQTLLVPPGKTADKVKAKPGFSVHDLPKKAEVAHEAPAYTTSIDAALTLRPKRWSYHLFTPPLYGKKQPTASLYPPGKEWHSNRIIESGGASMPIAICIAALRARSATGGD